MNGPNLEEPGGVEVSGMFVQIITAKAVDAPGLRRQWDTWHDELRAGAAGWEGAAAGVTPKDDFVAAVRFASEDAARANADRPEQSGWWASTEALLTDVRFDESSDVTIFPNGGADEARFVQMMRATVANRARFEDIEAESEALMRLYRPDFMGGYRVWLTDDVVHVVDYFTSEAEARKGESRDMPQGLKAQFEEWFSLLSDVRWYDVPEPWLRSA